MMARTVETAREGEGDEDGLRESATDAFTGADSGNIMGRQQPDLPALEQTRYLLTSLSVDRIARKAAGGRRPEAILEIPVEERHHVPPRS